MSRKIDGAAVAEKFGDGYRLKLKARTGEEIHIDLTAEAASELAGQLEPRAAAPAPGPAPNPRAAASSPKPKPAARRASRKT